VKNELYIAKQLVEDEKFAENTSKEGEDIYRNLVERADIGIVIIQDSIVKHSNSYLAKTWGGKVEDVIGTPFTRYIHPDEIPKLFELYKRRMAGEKVPSTYESVLVDKNGEKIYAELKTEVMHYQGRPADFVIIRNIMQQKKAEEYFRKKRFLW